jgi:glyoxylase-like metal-dependent hydrolase (beta-lactamase superfamily II)
MRGATAGIDRSPSTGRVDAYLGYRAPVLWVSGIAAAPELAPPFDILDLSPGSTFRVTGKFRAIVQTLVNQILPSLSEAWERRVKPGLCRHILKQALFLPAARCALLSAVFAFILPVTAAQIPEWCKALPRPEYKALERVQVTDAWFEVYKVAADTYAIYEPHQSEETIAYLILGKQKAILFDTGMGISDIRKVLEELTKLPVIVLNSHTHDDHVGGNWQFKTIYSMDTKFSRENAKGSVEDAQAEIAPGEICGDLPKGFDRKTYHTRAWKITRYIGDGDKIDLGGRVIQVLATPGHTPDAITLYDRANGLLFTGDTYYPATIWLYRPETNLDQYGKSIEQLAVLAHMEPSLKLVLGAHNVPVAPPSVLPGLVQAFADLRAGKAKCKADKPGRQVCTVGDFSFLVRAH